jgi:hypothetical protein
LTGGVHVKGADPLPTDPKIARPVGASGTALEIVMLKAACAVAPLASVTTSVNRVVTALVVGVPLICHVNGLLLPVLPKANPAGRLDPLASDQTYGCRPPIALNVCVYAAPIEALPSERWATLNASVIEILIVAVALTPFASVTTTEVVVDVAEAPTMPEIEPEVESVRPEGSAAPEFSRHVYGATPPDAMRVAWYAPAGEPIGSVVDTTAGAVLSDT